MRTGMSLLRELKGDSSERENKYLKHRATMGDRIQIRLHNQDRKWGFGTIIAREARSSIPGRSEWGDLWKTY